MTTGESRGNVLSSSTPVLMLEYKLQSSAMNLWTWAGLLFHNISLLRVQSMGLLFPRELQLWAGKEQDTAGGKGLGSEFMAAFSFKRHSEEI